MATVLHAAESAAVAESKQCINGDSRVPNLLSAFLSIATFTSQFP